MRKILAMTLAGGLLLATLPNAALAGDTHAVSNRWAGVAIGAAAVAVVGGLFLSAIQPPVAPPPVVYAPPPVVYAPPPAVYYAPPPMYAPPPVVVYRGWGPPGQWGRGYNERGRGWHRD